MAQKFSKGKSVLALKRAVRRVNSANDLGALAADTTRELEIFGHDRHPLGRDGAQVGEPSRNPSPWPSFRRSSREEPPRLVVVLVLGEEDGARGADMG